jgi:CO dehydrogenase maturation factor
MDSGEKTKTKIVAVCGKGGVGKTSVSAVMTKILVDRGDQKVLAVDADPAVGLASSLGVRVRKSVDDIRNDLIGRIKKGHGGGKQEIVERLDYEVLDAIEERHNLAFLAIGRPEKEGCYCQVNNILRDIIASITESFDYVIIDGEAGVEQVNRRVMEKVSHLVLVSDSSVKGLHVAQTIKEVSDEAIDYEEFGLILNKIRDQEEKDRLAILPALNCLGWIPEDEVIRSFDIKGRSILEISECKAMDSVESCLKRIGLFG